jgi:hypothetical protein
LHVALEHLQRHHHRVAPPGDALEQGHLHPVGGRVVVLLSHEDQVGAAHRGDQGFEIGEALVAGVVDPVGDVRGSQGARG